VELVKEDLKENIDGDIMNVEIVGEIIRINSLEGC